MCQLWKIVDCVEEMESVPALLKNSCCIGEIESVPALENSRLY